MEGIGGGLINVESKTRTELEGELTEAEKVVDRLGEKIVIDLFEKQLHIEDDVDGREPEVKLEILVERKAEEIIPKECWGLVFRHLDADDLLSCLQVCKTFKQILDLKEFKEKWQFKLILPHLFPYLKLKDRWGKESWKHLYNPRLACRSWRHSIDKYASEVNGTSFFPLKEISKMPLVTRFHTSEDIEEFRKKFGEWNRSPFPSSSVYIGYQRADEEDREVQQRLEDAYNENVGELLEQFGKHIFRLELCFSRQACGPDALTFCKLVKIISTHLPHLREFITEGGLFAPRVADKRVASYIAENPLAPLPKLQKLRFAYLNEKVGDYLLDVFSPQLTQLEITSSTNVPNQFHMQGLKNVRKLELKIMDLYNSLESLRFLHSPLEHLKLNCSVFGSASRQKAWNVHEFLRNLKHLPIKTLEIRWFFHRGGNLAESGIALEEYRNTSIKTLNIQIYAVNDVNVQISFNFLQALTKVENLKLKFLRGFRTTHPEEVAEVVRLNEYLLGEGTNRMYESNVWEKVPSLKTITTGLIRHVFQDAFVNQAIFTREKYENYGRIKMIAEADVPGQN